MTFELKQIIIDSMANFYKKVKKNRKKLREQGFSAAAICRYEKGNRLPSFENALKIAEVLKIPVTDIPYRQIIINRP